jgi:hypothetical protein
LIAAYSAISNTSNITYDDLAAQIGSGITGGLSVVRTLSAQYANADQMAATTTTDDQIFATTFTLPADYLIAGKVLRVTFGLNGVSTASPTQILRLSVGGANIMSSTAVAPTSGTFYTGLQFLITGTEAASASSAVDFECVHHYLSTASASRWTGGGLANCATNGTLTIGLVVKWSANTAGNTLNLRQMIVEALT